MEEPIRPHHAQAQESLRAMRIPGSKHGAPGVTASIAWRGLVLMKDAAQSATGVKGRMVAREATTGKIVWEFLLVPKTAVAAGGATAADYEEPCKDPTEARTPWLHLQRVRADERPAPKESPTNRR
jgi:hypothetical protein